MSGTHDEMVVLAPAYVLGALEADERRAFEAHLAECDRCATEVRSFSRVTSGLAQSVPQVTPRAALRDRVLHAVGARDVRAAEPKVHARWAIGNWLAYAACVAVATAAVLYAMNLRARVDLQGAPAAPQAVGRALWSRQSGMVFAATNLPPLPAGKIYQVWLVAGGPPISAGLVAPDEIGRGVGIFRTPIDVTGPVTVAVTIEPEGGVPAPTGAFYLTGKSTAGV